MESRSVPISRVTRSKQAAKASYDLISRWYDPLVGWGEKKYRDIGLGKLRVTAGEQVLEIGFGTGHCTLALARSVGSKGKVYGLDLSEGMRNITQAKVNRAGLADRVELNLGDAAHLPFDSNFFDAVFTSFTLELFDTPEIPVVLQQCRNVLHSGGRIGVVSMSKEGKDTAARKLYEWGHSKFSNYVDCRPIYVGRAMEEAGFQIVDKTTMPYWGLPVEIVMAQKT